MTKLLTHAAIVASLTAVSQAPGDLEKSLGQERRICATVAGYEFVHPTAHHGDCSVKLDLAGPDRKTQFYVLLPKEALGAFPAKPEEAYVTRQVCVTGTVESDSKRALHIVARAPAQIESIDPPGPPFGFEAHRLCETGIERPALVREVNSRPRSSRAKRSRSSCRWKLGSPLGERAETQGITAVPPSKALRDLQFALFHLAADPAS
jgi:hypothetical protein